MLRLYRGVIHWCAGYEIGVVINKPLLFGFVLWDLHLLLGDAAVEILQYIIIYRLFGDAACCLSTGDL